MTNILALDASTERCSVALLTGHDLREKINDVPRSHAQCLLPMVDGLLAESGHNLRDIDAIAFGAGPGSFTGLRICLGVAQGLAFGADLPMVAVSGLEAMALAACKREPEICHVIPAIDARMNEVYWAAYTVADGKPELVIPPQVSDVDAVGVRLGSWMMSKQVMGVGTGWNLLEQIQPSLFQTYTTFWPEAGAVAELAVSAFAAGHFTDAMAAEPIYLRNEISWKKRERIRQ